MKVVPQRIRSTQVVTHYIVLFQRLCKSFFIHQECSVVLNLTKKVL